MADIGNFSAASNAIAGANAAQNLLSIENPNGSGVNVFVRRVRSVSIVDGLFATPFAIKIGRTTAAPTMGTTLTAVQHMTASSAPAAIVRTGPTATLAAGLSAAMSPGALLGIAATGSFVPSVLSLFETDNESDSIMLAPDEGLLVVVEANSTDWTHYVDVWWGENVA